MTRKIERAARDAMALGPAHEGPQPARRFAPLPAEVAPATSIAERLLIAALMLGCAAIVIRGLVAFAHDLGLVG